MKLWKINKPDENIVSDVLRRTDLSRTAAEILVSRGIYETDALDEFFNRDELSDPFEIIDMDKAADAINEAVSVGERICIYGDYDCDGVTSSSLLYLYLEMLGADVFCYIPERSEGYGLNTLAIDRIAQQGAELIITVDNGISAIDEAQYIKDLGIKLVITDHHQPGEVLPEAIAVVDPHRADCPSEFKELAGVGVALKLAAACEGGDYSAVFEQFADLAAVGTIADLVSLTGENRIIVSRGLRYLENTENAGLNSLMNKCLNGSIDSTSVAFGIAPRINAAGRFGSPMTAFKALTADSEEEADEYVDQLISLNNSRRSTEDSIMSEILAFINENPEVLYERVLVLAGRGWHSGVIGIVAAKLLNLFSKPVFLMTVDESGNGIGSARSIDGYNIYEALSACKDILVKYGGHEKAGGFTVRERDIEEFRSRLLDYSKDRFPVMPSQTISVDMIIKPAELTVENIKTLSILPPYGEGNPEPVFAVPGARVTGITPLKGGKHSKITFEYGGVKEQALFFFCSPENLGFAVYDTVDILVNISVNVYAGKESLSIKVIDRRLSGMNQNKYIAAANAYEAYKRGEQLSDSYISAMTPKREELVTVYKELGALRAAGIDCLYSRVAGHGINFAKFKISIDIFEETGLAAVSAADRTVSIKKVKERVDITKSKILTTLKNS